MHGCGRRAIVRVKMLMKYKNPSICSSFQQHIHETYTTSLAVSYHHCHLNNYCSFWWMLECCNIYGLECAFFHIIYIYIYIYLYIRCTDKFLRSFCEIHYVADLVACEFRLLRNFEREVVKLLSSRYSINCSSR